MNSEKTESKTPVQRFVMRIDASGNITSDREEFAQLLADVSFIRRDGRCVFCPRRAVLVLLQDMSPEELSEWLTYAIATIYREIVSIELSA